MYSKLREKLTVASILATVVGIKTDMIGFEKPIYMPVIYGQEFPFAVKAVGETILSEH